MFIEIFRRILLCDQVCLDMRSVVYFYDNANLG